MLEFLNYFFFTGHALLIVFNALGWAWRRTRPWQLLTLALTGASWFVLGIWYGWGYCVCTDWHWRVRAALGYHDDNDSYIYLLINKLTGLRPSVETCQSLALGVFVAALALGVTLNVRDFIRARRRPRPVDPKT
jgi:hypothetical protein